ncbi:protein PHTF2 isoform X3 [Hydra vulgaris]|uniref:Protein PHTF2 isoform X3 n=1 Tax=Hydra vulgaris TaxID=6087 RepID=A0ABM4BS99_HYDVU
MDLNGAISWFQTKIGTYDKANWEITVEKHDVDEILTDCLSNANLPKDLLDIDLIRGSTFTKAKPFYHWTSVTSAGLLKVIFFPLYFRWWQQQTSFKVWLFFLTLYFLQLLSLVIYVTHQTEEEFINISWPEAFVPLLAMVLLGELYIHVVSTNFTKPAGRNIKKQRSGEISSEPKKRKRSCRKRPKRLDEISESRDASTERILAHDQNVDQVSTENFQILAQSETDINLNLGLRKRFSKNSVNETNIEESCERKREVHSVDETTSNQSETDSDSTNSSESISENEAKDSSTQANVEKHNLLFSNSVYDAANSNTLFNIRHINDLITVSIWDGNSFKKAKMNFFEIGMAVVKKVESRKDKRSDYLTFAIISSCIIGMLPLFFRIYQFHVANKDRQLLDTLSRLLVSLKTIDGIVLICKQLFGPTWRPQLIVFIAMLSRLTLSFSTFFLLCVAESAYKVRYIYAKLFGMITSTRRSRRNRLPHFRLYKVNNIKAWLSLRSFLKKRGPQRSVDTIVSTSFLSAMLLVVLTCIQFLSINVKEDSFLSYFFSWELTAWSLVLGVFLIRFIALGSDINRKYKNTSILLTEQINLYLQMEKNPNKKEDLLIANNVLKLASKLLKELEGPFKVSGFIMNPLLSNITRVMVLSLFSGVMSDILGFRLRLWKIKA